MEAKALFLNVREPTHEEQELAIIIKELGKFPLPPENKQIFFLSTIDRRSTHEKTS